MDVFTLDKLPREVLAKIDLQTAFMASRCIIAAERFQLFRKLQGKELTAAEICRAVRMKKEKGLFFLAALQSLGLLKRKGDKYRNSPLAERYFIRERSIFWTRRYSEECIEEYRAFSVLEEMLTTGRGFESILGIKRQWYMEKIESDPDWARDFTHMLYYHHLDVAKAMAETIDLTGYQNLLDVGGGSGVISLALARRFPDLTATVLDLEPVCRTAKQIIRREKMTGRVKTKVGDMTRGIPSGYDVIMFCDAGDTSVETLSRVFDLLPDQGMIVFADSFSSEDFTQPFVRLMWQLRSTTPWLVTHKEVMVRLRQAGFKSVKRRRLTTDMWLVAGVKK